MRLSSFKICLAAILVTASLAQDAQPVDAAAPPSASLGENKPNADALENQPQEVVDTNKAEALKTEGAAAKETQDAPEAVPAEGQKAKSADAAQDAGEVEKDENYGFVRADDDLEPINRGDEDMESGFHMDDFQPSHVYTFPVESGREECFHKDIEVVPSDVRGAYFVSSSSSMDISFSASLDINGSPMMLKSSEGNSEDTFELTATRAGVYSFCFKSPSSRYGEKVVTFAIHVIRRASGEESGKPAYAQQHHVVSLAASVQDIRKTVSELEAEQLFLKERTTRHMMTQDSTEWRVAWYTVFESVFMFAIAFGQVWYVQRLINQRVWV